MKDRFSKHAKQYATFRPTYPRALYDFLLSHVVERKTAWDCGCGNGQVAFDLSKDFEKVFATDISAKQLENAIAARNISYSVSAAEKTSFNENSFDLITVGQALHWFDIPAFFNEARRVGKKNGIVAVWGYGLLKINEDIDPIIAHFYRDIIGPYWDKERKLVDDAYRSVSFPFEEFSAPPLDFSFEWTFGQLQGYLSTWSSVQKFIAQQEVNPVDGLMEQIRPLWTREILKVTFPLFGRFGRII